METWFIRGSAELSWYLLIILLAESSENNIEFAEFSKYLFPYRFECDAKKWIELSDVNCKGIDQTMVSKVIKSSDPMEINWFLD